MSKPMSIFCRNFTKRCWNEEVWSSSRTFVLLVSLIFTVFLFHFKVQSGIGFDVRSESNGIPYFYFHFNSGFSDPSRPIRWRCLVSSVDRLQWEQKKPREWTTRPSSWIHDSDWDRLCLAFLAVPVLIDVIDYYLYYFRDFHHYNYKYLNLNYFLKVNLTIPIISIFSSLFKWEQRRKRAACSRPVFFLVGHGGSRKNQLRKIQKEPIP